MNDNRVALIAEDDPDVRDLIEIVLTQSGFWVVHAADGPAAIAAVREHDPLLTTLDVNMPGMDGFAVAKKLREFSQTYLIMITALTQEIDIIRGFEAGADDYLVKPFRPRELRARADSMLRRAAFASGETHLDESTTPAPAKKPAPAPAESWAAAATREFRSEMSPASRDGHDPEPASRRRHRDSEPPSPPPTPAAPAPPVTPPPAEPAPAVAAAPIVVSSSDSSAGGSEVKIEGHLRTFRGITVDTQSGSAALQSRSLGLNEPEMQLLVSLLDSGRRVRSKADLVLALRGNAFVTSHFVNEADKRAVEMHIAALRAKLGDDEASPKFIETVRGVGFRLAG